tara:strand:- start:177 stop:437 length:261 start_codon:yes stop_codon:yes gene_type:complete
MTDLISKYCDRSYEGSGKCIDKKDYKELSKEDKKDYYKQNLDMKKKYTMEQILDYWEFAYGEDMRDEYSGFVEGIQKEVHGIKTKK